ncbi:hypothetical protein DITRI_Ditri10aG0028200 [Diplodiscus trichospermus]
MWLEETSREVKNLLREKKQSVLALVLSDLCHDRKRSGDWCLVIYLEGWVLVYCSFALYKCQDPTCSNCVLMVQQLRGVLNSLAFLHLVEGTYDGIAGYSNF